MILLCRVGREILAQSIKRPAESFQRENQGKTAYRFCKPLRWLLRHGWAGTCRAAGVTWPGLSLRHRARWSVTSAMSRRCDVTLSSWRVTPPRHFRRPPTRPPTTTTADTLQKSGTKSAENYNKWHANFFLKLQSAFRQFQAVTVSGCLLIELLPYILFEKYIDILALQWPAQGTGTVPIVSAHFRSL